MSHDKTLGAHLERAIAIGQLDKKAVFDLADRIQDLRIAPARVDWCIYGICLDYVVPRGRIGGFLRELVDRLRVVDRPELFPLGIPVPELWRVQVISDARTGASPGLIESQR